MKYNYDDYWENPKFNIKTRKPYYDKIYGSAKKKYSFNQEDEIADIAGGNGFFANYLGVKNCTLLDVSDSGLKIARDSFGYNAVKCDLVNGEWPVKNNSFDIVICNEFLEHVWHPSIALSKINKILKKGGKIYIGQPNVAPDGSHHVRHIKYGYLKFILEENGFKIKKVRINTKIINLKFSNLENTQTKKVRLKIIIGSIISLFVSKKMAHILTYKFPDVFGGFYHIEAVKVA